MEVYKNGYDWFYWYGKYGNGYAKGEQKEHLIFLDYISENQWIK